MGLEVIIRLTGSQIFFHGRLCLARKKFPAAGNSEKKSGFPKKLSTAVDK
jgi:hypothetical protein